MDDNNNIGGIAFRAIYHPGCSFSAMVNMIQALNSQVKLRIMFCPWKNRQCLECPNATENQSR